MVALGSFAALADEQQPNDISPDTEPGMAFFEFLAELEQVNGEWLSPIDMLEIEQEDGDSVGNEEQKP